MNDGQSASPGNCFVLAGAVSAFLAVALGAFGAHALKDRLDAYGLGVYQTASQYQMYHAIALIALGLWSNQQAQRMPLAGWSWIIGTLLFSGSLYALAITGIRALGAITPFGGVLFLLGWIVFAFRAWKV